MVPHAGTDPDLKQGESYFWRRVERDYYDYKVPADALTVDQLLARLGR